MEVEGLGRRSARERESEDPEETSFRASFLRAIRAWWAFSPSQVLRSLPLVFQEWELNNVQ